MKMIDILFSSPRVRFRESEILGPRFTAIDHLISYVYTPADRVAFIGQRYSPQAVREALRLFSPPSTYRTSCR